MKSKDVQANACQYCREIGFIIDFLLQIMVRKISLYSLDKLQVFFALYIHQSINPLAWTECGGSLPISGASSIPPYHTLFSATPLRQPLFHPPSLHPAIYFLVCLLVLLFPNSCTILLEILFSSILCTCPNQRNLCSLIVSLYIHPSVN